MSSSIEDTYGSLYIFGTHQDGYVDVNWSVTQDTIVSHIHLDEAYALTKAWNALLDKAEEQL